MGYVDKKLPLQVLRYQSRIWESYERGEFTNGELLPSEGVPVIVPVVFYHGRQRWNSPLSVAGMLPEGTPEVFREFTPASECIMHDLGTYESKELSRDVVSWAVLSALVMSRQGTVPPERLREVVAAIPPDHPLLLHVIQFIVQTMDLHEEDLERIGRVSRPQDWEMVMGTVAEQIRQRCLVEGRAEGQVKMLLRLMSRRFGNLSPDVRSRIHAGSEREIDAWADAVLDAESLEAVLAASS